MKYYVFGMDGDLLSGSDGVERDDALEVLNSALDDGYEVDKLKVIVGREVELLLVERVTGFVD